MPTSTISIGSATLPTAKLPGPWTRIEPISRASSLRPGLAAAIADPLWMLGRQHQVGELSGEDAASPVRVRGQVDLAPIAALLPGEGGRSASLSPTSAPPETLLEREDPLAGPGRTRAAADAGLLLMRSLTERGLSELWGLLQVRFRLSVPADATVETRLLARRSLDGHRLLSIGIARYPELSRHPKSADLLVAIREWTSLVSSRWTAPGDKQGSWVDERQEYDFKLGTSATNAVLHADDHPGGRLDWYSADATGSAPIPSAIAEIKAVPTPVRFRGSPASRWWEIEDGAVDWCDIEGGPEDPARLMVAEFMTVYGDDWFVVPIRLARGQLARVSKVSVADTFTWRAGGAESTMDPLPAIASVDGEKRTFKLFELRDDTPPSDAKAANWLYIPSCVGDLQEGDPIEEVRFLRDETSNLGWAVERVVEGPTGGPIQWAGQRPPIPEARTDGRWVYAAQTAVPRGWMPLVPVKCLKAGAEDAQIRLRRGRLPDWTADDEPKGRIASGKPFYLREEELPPGGIIVTRSWQRTRGPDGAVWLWIGREKRPGHAEPGPGLAFDQISR